MQERPSEPATDDPPVRPDGGSSLFDRFPDPVVRLGVGDEGLTVERVNDAFVETFGTDRSTLPGLDASLERRLDAGERVEETVAVPADPATDGGDGSRRTDARHFDLRHVPDEAGGWLVYTDVTARQTLRTENQRLDEFAHTVSHDLRNPLDVAKMRLDAARETGDDVHFEKVEKAHDRMERIIEDVLELAKQGDVIGSVETVPIRSVAEDAWTNVEAPDATLVVEDDCGSLEADGDRLQELFENLFRNAVRYAGAGVTVTVTADETGFAVGDDGDGIPADERDDVWESGYTTSDSGTGFGLAIVRRIADAHGWSVTLAESESGGARFEFVI